MSDGWMRKSVRWAATAACAGSLWGVSGTAAGEDRVSGWGGIGYLGGDTTYQIGGTVTLADGTREQAFFPFSELKFPLETPWLLGGVTLPFADRFLAEARAGLNLAKDCGTLEDSDWLDNPHVLDVFSKSDATLKGMTGDADVRFLAIRRPTWSLGFGAGVLYQDYSFKARLVRQWSPSGRYDADAVGDGSVGITYDVTYLIPYVLVSAGASFDRRISATLRLDLAPLVKATDKDVHLLRDPPITAKGDYSGTAARFTGRGRYDFTDRLYAFLEASVLSIEADGKQKNYLNGAWSHTTDAKVLSTQSSYLLGLGFGF